MSSQPRAERRRTQRERLLAGMITSAHRHGFAGASVSHVIDVAGVSRATFYEYFENKQDCFAAANRELATALSHEVERALAAQPPGRAVHTTIELLIELAKAFPERASFLANETMAAGHRGLEQRDRLIDRIAQLVERRLAEAEPEEPVPDLPIQLVLGAGRWLLAPCLRHGEPDLTQLGVEMIDWVEAYAMPAAQRRWRTLEPGPRLPPSPHVSQMSLHPSPSIPRGRPTIDANEIARNQRERILYATAEIASEKGYLSTTVADIASAAGVDRRVFYAHFRDKQHAFLDAHELGIQQLMALSATAFFSAETWPERVWAATHAATQFQEMNPLVTHIALVESHAVGAQAIQRIDDSRAAFTIFLQEGNLLSDRPASRVAMEAIGGAVFELSYRQARAGRSDRIPRLTCHGVYVILARFVGPREANAFIDAKLHEAASSAGRTARPGGRHSSGQAAQRD